MAITDFASLKTAIDAWSDSAGSINDEQLGEFVLFATQMFNDGSADVSALRIRQMEAISTLTPTSGVYTLPADYLQYRRVTEDASYRGELSYITPSRVDEMYPDSSAGLSQHFTIIGSSLYTFPTSTNNVELTYYQKIPNLTTSATTNWLLTVSPSLYLHGALFQLAMFRRDTDLQQRSAGMVVSLMSGLSGTDMLANYAYAPGQVRGMVIA